MNRLSRCILALCLVGLISGVTTASAQAAKRRVPFGFFGTVLSPELSSAGKGLSDATLDAQTGLMARSGVESVRLLFNWASIEPQPGVYNWPAVDRLVAAAARHRLAVLANVAGTPRWASQQPNSTYFYRYAPSDPKLLADLVRQLVQRYGPRGTLWTLNRTLPRVPVREWQIWNEQAADFAFASTPWPSNYTRLLGAAYVAIHRADRGAKVVAGSVVGVGSSTPWDQMRQMYRAGARKYFDVVSVHPFTINPTSVSDTVKRVVAILTLVRAQMRHYGDSRKPLIITELAWPAAIGRVPQSRLLGLETNTAGQTKRLTAAYARLAADNRLLHIAQVDWFSWASPYDANSPQSDVSYRFTGLLRYAGDNLGYPVTQAFTSLPLLRTYSNAAARYEGCRKRADARRCR